MAELLAVAMAALVLWVTRLLWRRYSEFKALARPTAEPGGSQAAHITVIIPARNEEANLPLCLSALLAQTYTNFDIIVVDDNSSDRTPEILREFSKDPRVRTLAAPPPPPGWMGKSHALWQGSRLVENSDWLFFLNADTFGKPELLAASLAYSEANHIDLISVLPRLEIPSVIAGIVQPVIIAILNIFLPVARTNDPRDPFGYVVGACLGIRRAVYESVEGHKAIHDTLADDVAFGQLVKSSGYRIEIVDGRHLALTRMYSSLREIWDGWSASFYDGLRQRWYLLPITLVASLAMLAYLSMTTVHGFHAARNGVLDWALALNGVTLVYLLIFLGIFRLRVGRENYQSDWYALTYPLGLLMTGGIALATVLRTLFGLGQMWKGRRYT